MELENTRCFALCGGCSVIVVLQAAYFDEEMTFNEALLEFIRHISSHLGISNAQLQISPAANSPYRG